MPRPPYFLATDTTSRRLASVSATLARRPAISVSRQPVWRALVRLEEAEPRRIVLPSSADRVVPFDRVGVLRTPWGPLDAWQCAAYGNGLWIPVRDAGSGTLSFGGGRYLYDTANGVDLGSTRDGELVVDLNFLYAPACAHDPRELSPLPPAGNRLGVVVPVGELLPG